MLAIVLTLYRPLLLSSLNAEIAAARGIPVRLIGMLYLLALALAAALAAITIGTILCTALLVGPAASALRLTRRPLTALLSAAGIGIGATWLGIVLAYDSYDWPPAGQGWPVSFFVVTLVFIAYLLSGLPEARRRRRAAGPVRPRRAAGDAELAAHDVLRLHGQRLGRSRPSSPSSRASSGFFTVLRGSAFAAHAIPNGSFAGAAGASLIGVSTLLGLGVFALGGALTIGLLGRRGPPRRRHRPRARDDARPRRAVPELQRRVRAGGLLAAVRRDPRHQPQRDRADRDPRRPLRRSPIAILYRPLMLSSVLPEVGEARGVSASAWRCCFLAVLALATTMTVPVVGTLLIFSLMIGAPAAARSFTDRPLLAMALSVAIALLIVWSAIAASYETNYPVGFFVGSGSAVSYTIGRLWAAWRRGRGTAPTLLRSFYEQ